MRISVLAVLAPLAAGCLAHAPRGQAPLDGEAEVWVYLEPFPRGAERLALTVGALAAEREDGAIVPLRVRAPHLSARDRAERLLASGRLEPGRYVALRLEVKRATLAGDGGATDLLVPEAPSRVEVAFALAPRAAAVVSLSLRYGASVRTGFAFTPAFGAAVPDRPPPQLAGFCSATASHAVVEFDLHARRPVAVLPTGAEPRGLALDDARGRLYVALSGDDEIQVLDAFTGAGLGRIPLQPGDRPGEVALTPDGRTLLAVAAGTSALSFLDPTALVETGRVETGEDPSFLLVDRQGRRAYVLNRRSSSVTVIDLPTRAVVATVRTEAEPVRARLDRAGTRLFVLHAGSPYLVAVSLADLTVARLTFVGLGASALVVDPRTDLLYVGRQDDDRLQIYDPASLLPLGSVALPGPPVRGAIQDAENVLFVALREGAVAAVDLAGGRVVASFDVGEAPHQVVVAGARR